MRGNKNSESARRRGNKNSGVSSFQIDQSETPITRSKMTQKTLNILDNMPKRSLTKPRTLIK